MKRIDFEAHFATEGYMKLMLENKGFPRCRVDEKTKNRYLSYSDEVELKLVDRIRDGLLDLVVGNYSTYVSILIGDGIGGFAPQILCSVGGNPTSIRDLDVGDFNNDGDFDDANETAFSTVDVDTRNVGILWLGFQTNANDTTGTMEVTQVKVDDDTAPGLCTR